MSATNEDKPHDGPCKMSCECSTCEAGRIHAREQAAEIEQLKGELEESAGRNMELQNDLMESRTATRKLDDMWRHRMSALDKQLAEARKDSARLDWLERSDVPLYVSEVCTLDMTFNRREGLRAAIDAAMETVS